MTKQEFIDARQFLSESNYKGCSNWTQSKMANLLTRELRTVQNYEAGNKIPPVVVRKVQDLLEHALIEGLKRSLEVIKLDDDSFSDAAKLFRLAGRFICNEMPRAF